MRLTEEAIAALQQHHWPGNVRELENTIARASALCTTDLLLAEDIPFARSPFSLTQKISTALDTLLLSTSETGENLLQHLISEICKKAFEQSGNNLKETAQQLGIKQSELREHLGR